MDIFFDVLIVTYNNGDTLEKTLISLVNQSYTGFKIYLWDNSSRDNTLKIVENFAEKIDYIYKSDKNVGFSKAINSLIKRSGASYLVFLNPDVILPSDFMEKLRRKLRKIDSEKIIPVPKLLRYDENFNLTNIVDSTGIVWNPFQRHLDRGSGKRDGEKFNVERFVGGVSGALSIWKRSILENLSITTGEVKEFLDEDFFVYREDADISFRALIYGYKFRFFPELVAYHKRKVLPERRKILSPEINYHSFKNRFLFRIKNIPMLIYFLFFIPFSIRDTVGLVYVLFFERTSLKAIPYIFKNFKRFVVKRIEVLKKRKLALTEIALIFIGKY